MCASMRRARALLSPCVPSIKCVLYRKRTHALHARSACAPARVQRARAACEQQLQLPYSASYRVVSAAPVGRGRVGQCACMHTHSPRAPALGARPRSGRQGSRQRRRGRCTACTTRLPLRYRTRQLPARRRWPSGQHCACCCLRCKAQAPSCARARRGQASRATGAAAGQALAARHGTASRACPPQARTRQVARGTPLPQHWARRARARPHANSPQQAAPARAGRHPRGSGGGTGARAQLRGAWPRGRTPAHDTVRLTVRRPSPAVTCVAASTVGQDHRAQGDRTRT